MNCIHCNRPATMAVTLQMQRLKTAEAGRERAHRVAYLCEPCAVRVFAKFSAAIDPPSHPPVVAFGLGTPFDQLTERVA